MQPILLLPKAQFTPLEDITIQGLIKAGVNIILIITALLFVFSLLTGGIKFMLSGGSRDKTEESRRQLMNAFIGIFIVFCAWAIMSFISTFYGIDLLSFEIPTI